MGNMPGSMGYMPPRGPMPRFQATARSPRQQFRSPGGGLRHQPYPVTRPIQAAASPVRSPMKSPAKLDGQTIKLEPDDETSNQSATSQPSSPSSHQNMKSKPGADDANSESSSSHNEQNQEGLGLGADLSNSVSGDNIEHDPDVSVKLEAISDAEMDLEITGVEPGRPMQPQDWGANASVMNFDPTGATGSQADMTGQQGYNYMVPCPVCFKAFHSHWALQRHTCSHTGKRSNVYLLCDGTFTCSHTGKRSNVYLLCERTFTQKHLFILTASVADGTMSHLGSDSTKGFLEDHEDVKSQFLGFSIKDWHVCDHCQKAFKCVSELACHVLIHQEEKPFECSICHTRFTHRSSLKKHSLVHMDTKCKQDTRLQQRRETTSKGKIVCDHCQKGFKRNSYLARHLLTHTGERPFECIVCHKRFYRKCTLKAHMLVHTGEMPFECSVCDKRFNRKDHLKCHTELVHKGESPFECSVCHKQFSLKGHLICHMLVHTGEKPFECSVCHKRFNQKSTLARHILVHTAEKPFECSFCDKRFNRKGHLKDHMLVHTGDKPFECSVCHKRFNHKSHLKRHTASVHKEGRRLSKTISKEEHL